MSSQVQLNTLLTKRTQVEKTIQTTETQTKTATGEVQQKEGQLQMLESADKPVREKTIINDQTGETEIITVPDEEAIQKQQRKMDELQGQIKDLNQQIKTYEGTIKQKNNELNTLEKDISAAELELEEEKLKQEKLEQEKLEKERLEQERLNEEAKKEEIATKNIKGGITNEDFKGNQRIFNSLDTDKNGILDDNEMQDLRNAAGEDGVFSKKEAKNFGKTLNLNDKDLKDVRGAALGFSQASANIESSDITVKDGVKTINIKRKDGTSSQIVYASDENGQVSKKTVETDANNNSVETNYDSKGNRTRTVETDTGTGTVLTNNYNSEGEIESTVETSGQTEVTYGRGGKASGQQTKIIENKGTENEIVTENEYDENGTKTKTVKSNKDGKVEEHFEDGKTSTKNYNAQGQLVSSVEKEFDENGNVVRESTIKYNENGYRISQEVKNSSNDTQTVTYDGKGNTNVVVQNNENYYKLHDKFGSSDQSVSEFREELEELNPEIKKHGLIVGADIVIPGEVEADAEALDGRNDAKTEIGQYTDVVVNADIKKRLDSGEAVKHQVTVEGEYSSWTDYAKQKLKNEGIENPTTEQITSRTNEYLYLNPDVKCPKAGAAISEIKSSFDIEYDRNMAFYENAGYLKEPPVTLNSKEKPEKFPSLEELKKLPKSEQAEVIKRFRQTQLDEFNKNTNDYLTQAEKNCFNSLSREDQDRIIIKTNEEIRAIKNSTNTQVLSLKNEESKSQKYNDIPAAKQDAIQTSPHAYTYEKQRADTIVSQKTMGLTTDSIVQKCVIDQLPQEALNTANENYINNETPEQKNCKQITVDYYENIYNCAKNFFDGEVAKEGWISDAINFVRDSCGSDTSREATIEDLEKFKKKLDTLKASQNTATFDRVCREQFGETYSQEDVKKYVEATNLRIEIDALKNAAEYDIFAELDAKESALSNNNYSYKAPLAIDKYSDSEKITKFEEYMKKNMGFTDNDIKEFKDSVRNENGTDDKKLLDAYRTFNKYYRTTAKASYQDKLAQNGGENGINQKLKDAQKDAFGSLGDALTHQVLQYQKDQECGRTIVKGAAIAIAGIATGGTGLAAMAAVCATSAGMEFVEQLSNDVDNDVTIGKNLLNGAVDGFFASWGGKYLVKPFSAAIGGATSKATSLVVNSAGFQKTVQKITTSALEGLTSTTGKEILKKGELPNFEKAEVKSLSKIVATLLTSAFEGKTGIKNATKILETSGSNYCIEFMKDRKDISIDILQDETKAQAWVNQHKDEFYKFMKNKCILT